MHTIQQKEAPGKIAVITKAWLIAGTLDIFSACTYYTIRTGNSPIRVLKFVASGYFGNEAIAGSNFYAVAGLLFHYLIAFIFTVFFFLICPYLQKMVRSHLSTALLYGIFVWLVMNRVVLPLSNTPKGPFQWQQALIGALILVCMIGLPMTLVIGKYFSAKKS